MECPGEDHKHGEVLQKKRYSDEFARNWFCSTLTDYQRIKVCTVDDPDFSRRLSGVLTFLHQNLDEAANVSYQDVHDLIVPTPCSKPNSGRSQLHLHLAELNCKSTFSNDSIRMSILGKLQFVTVTSHQERHVSIAPGISKNPQALMESLQWDISEGIFEIGNSMLPLLAWISKKLKFSIMKALHSTYETLQLRNSTVLLQSYVDTAKCLPLAAEWDDLSNCEKKTIVNTWYWKEQVYQDSERLSSELSEILSSHRKCMIHKDEVVSQLAKLNGIELSYAMVCMNVSSAPSCWEMHIKLGKIAPLFHDMLQRKFRKTGLCQPLVLHCRRTFFKENRTRSFSFSSRHIIHGSKDVLSNDRKHGNSQTSMGTQTSSTFASTESLEISPMTGMSIDLEVQLGQEILLFHQWCRSHANNRRQSEFRTVIAITKVIKRIMPEVSVRIFGSFVSGLSVPASDIDVVVSTQTGYMQPNHSDEDQRQFNQLASELQEMSCVENIQLVPQAQVPVIKIRAQCSGAIRSTNIDLTFSSAAHRGDKTTALTMELCAHYPILATLVVFLKQVLAEVSLNDGFQGGLTSYCIVLMCMSFLQIQPIAWIRSDVDAQQQFKEALARINERIDSVCEMKENHPSTPRSIHLTPYEGAEYSLDNPPHLVYSLPSLSQSLGGYVTKAAGGNDSHGLWREGIPPVQSNFTAVHLHSSLPGTSDADDKHTSANTRINIPFPAVVTTAEKGNPVFRDPVDGRTMKLANRNNVPQFIPVHSTRTRRSKCGKNNIKQSVEDASVEYHKFSPMKIHTETQTSPLNLVGMQVLRLLYFYGISFQPKKTGLSIRHGNLVDAAQKNQEVAAYSLVDPLWVLDPYDSSGKTNIGRNSYKFPDVQQRFRDVYRKIKAAGRNLKPRNFRDENGVPPLKMTDEQKLEYFPILSKFMKFE